MTVIEIENTNNLNPNLLHEHLIANKCYPVTLKHNRKYEDDELKTEATKIWIEIEERNKEKTLRLVEEYTSQ